jgi:hypothetical protein
MASSSSSEINKAATSETIYFTFQKTIQVVPKIYKANETELKVLSEMIMDFNNLFFNGFNLNPLMEL